MTQKVVHGVRGMVIRLSALFWSKVNTLIIFHIKLILNVKFLRVRKMAVYKFHNIIMIKITKIFVVGQFKRSKKEIDMKPSGQIV